MANLCVGQNFSEELTCAVCLDSWKDPAELSPCGHIFCKECASGLKDCPVCRKKIESSGQPNRTLVNMALQIRVKCMRCDWKGTREQGMRHECGSGGSQPQPPSTIKPPQIAQHPSATNPSSPYAYQSGQQPPNGGHAAYSSGPPNMTDLWQSGAPTNTPLPFNPPPQQQWQRPPQQQPQQQQGNYQGGHQSGYGTPYPGAAPPLSNNSYGQNYSPSPANSGGYQSYQSYQPQQSPPQQQKPTQQQQQAPPRASRRYQVIEPTGNYPWTLYDLGQSEYDQIVSLFVFFDEDDSGSLDRNEVSRLARWLNFANTPQAVQRIFDDMDADRSGSLSLGEFLSWLRHNKPNPQALYGLTQSQYNTIMMQFHTYDTNQDGCLEMNEFTRLVLSLRDVKDEATAQRLFQMIDRDRNGAIDLHEFLTFRAGKS